jgi:hypothetical protein
MASCPLWIISKYRGDEIADMSAIGATADITGIRHKILEAGFSSKKELKVSLSFSVATGTNANEAQECVIFATVVGKNQFIHVNARLVR